MVCHYKFANLTYSWFAQIRSRCFSSDLISDLRIKAKILSNRKSISGSNNQMRRQRNLEAQVKNSPVLHGLKPTSCSQLMTTEQTMLCCIQEHSSYQVAATCSSSTSCCNLQLCVCGAAQHFFVLIFYQAGTTLLCPVFYRRHFFTIVEMTFQRILEIVNQKTIRQIIHIFVSAQDYCMIILVWSCMSVDTCMSISGMFECTY